MLIYCTIFFLWLPNIDIYGIQFYNMFKTFNNWNVHLILYFELPKVKNILWITSLSSYGQGWSIDSRHLIPGQFMPILFDSHSIKSWKFESHSLNAPSLHLLLGFLSMKCLDSYCLHSGYIHLSTTK